MALGAPDPEAAAELWERSADLDPKPPVQPDLGLLSARVTAAHAAGSSALDVLRRV